MTLFLPIIPSSNAQINVCWTQPDPRRENNNAKKVIVDIKQLLNQWNTTELQWKIGVGYHFFNAFIFFKAIKSLLLDIFNRCTYESILTYCNTVWYDSCPSLDWKAQQQVVKTARHITGIKLLAIEGLNNMHCQELQSALPHVFWKVEWIHPSTYHQAQKQLISPSCLLDKHWTQYSPAHLYNSTPTLKS